MYSLYIPICEIVVKYLKPTERMATMLTVAELRDNLRRARRRAGLTQIELAEKSNVGITTITRIESGHIPEPRVSTLRKLARALGISPAELLED
jgi:predicted transcriptional regulator